MAARATRFSILLLCLAFFLQLPQAQSTDNEMGLKPYGSYDSEGLDNVNLSNGNLFVKIPLVAFPQRGSVPLSYSLYYNLKHFTNTNKTTCNANGCTTETVWTQRPGQIVAKPGGVYLSPDWANVAVAQLQHDDRFYCVDHCDTTQPVDLRYLYSSYSFLDAGHSYHPAGQTALNADGTQIWDALDGSGFRVSVGPQSYTQTGTVWDANGVMGAASSASTPCSYLSDPNGNCVQSDPSMPTTIKDTLGRPFPAPVATNDFTNCTGSKPTTSASIFVVPTVNGGSATYKLCSVTLNVNAIYVARDYDDPIVNKASGSFLQSVVLPDLTSWQFQYDDTTGDLTQITSPIGGTISYEPVASTPVLVGDVIYSRTLDAQDGTGPHRSTYTFQQGAANITTTVTDALLNDTVSTFIPRQRGDDVSYYVSKEQYYQGSASNHVLLKTADYVYQVDQTQINRNLDSGILPIAVTTTLPNGLVSQKTMQYDTSLHYCNPDPFDGERPVDVDNNALPCTTFSVTSSYGRLISESQSDWGQGNPGPILRTTQTNHKAFENANYLKNNLLSLPSQVSITDGGSRLVAQTNFGYDETDQTSSGITTGFNTNLAEGSAKGNLTSVSTLADQGTTATSTCPSSGSWITRRIDYYDTGMPYQTHDPCGSLYTYSYDPAYAGAYVTSTVNPLNHISSSTYDFNTGVQTSSTDVNRQTTSYSYLDPLVRMTDTTTPDTYPGTAVHGHSHFSYNTNSVQVDRSLDNTRVISTLQSVDGFGKLSRSELLSDPVSPVYSTTQRDALRRVNSVSNSSRCVPGSTCSEGTAGSTNYTYDALSRKTQESYSDNHAKSWSYDQTLTTYTDGTLSTYTNENSSKWDSYSDALGRLIRVVEYPQVGGSGNPTKYTYDALGNLTTVAQSGASGDTTRTRSFLYDTQSRLYCASNPENSIAACPSNKTQPIPAGLTTYKYDANGNLVSKTDARGAVSNYSYDVLNRLYQKSYVSPAGVDATPTVTYTYDSSPSTNTPNAVGRLTDEKVTSGANLLYERSVSAYDPLGRVSVDTRCIPGVCPNMLTVQYTYDLAGNELTASPNYFNVGGALATFHYGYDGAGRALSESLLDDTGGTFTLNVLSSVQYAPIGTISSTDGGVETRTYDNRGRTTSVGYDLSTAGFSPYSANYTEYDGVGNLKASEDSVNGAWSYNYDSLNRLQSSTSSLGGTAYTYDSFGNRLSQTGAGINNTESFLNGTNRMDCVLNDPSVTNCYDPAGNLLRDVGLFTTNAYTYDAENRLSSAAGTQYLYDGEGIRIAEYQGGTLLKGYIHEANNQYYVPTDGSGGATSAELFGAGRHVATISGNDLYFPFLDALGTERVRIGVFGGSVETITSLPFGDGLNVIGNDPSALHFTGKERDTESGLDYFGARYYTSTMGRWMSPDPSNWGVDFYNPQTWNHYSYVGNDPLSNTDPNGLWLTPTHNTIINNAFPGLSREERNILQAASRNVDSDQSQAGSYKHGMSSDDNDPYSSTGAYNPTYATNDFIEQNEHNAKKIQAEWLASGHSGISPAALAAFGNAAHTIADEYSPPHQGFQKITGPASFGFHLLRELPGVFGFYKQQQQQAAGALQSAFFDVFGSSQGDQATHEKVTSTIIFDPNQKLPNQNQEQ